MEDFMKRAESGDGRAAGARDEMDRKKTLVFGGWPMDTKRAHILGQLGQALKERDLLTSLDNEPFCTGPRRSTALAVFARRQGESEHDVRQRMHSIIKCVSDNQVRVTGGRRLFATWSKTKMERAIASHAAWVKRVVVQLDERQVPNLDLEYATGTAWMGDHMVASATRPLPPGTAPHHIVYNEEAQKVGKGPWVHVQHLASELGKDPEMVKQMLDQESR